MARAKNILGPGNWAKAYERLEEAIGPIDPMLTDGDEDAWQHWKRHASDIRGNVVHGNAEISGEQADWAIAYVEQLMRQMVLRMVVSGKHPASDVLMESVEALRKVRAAEQESQTPAYRPPNSEPPSV